MPSAEWITTSTVLARLRADAGEEAWHTFVERFRPAVVAFGRKLGLDDETSEDVAQETLLAFLRGLREGTYERSRGRLSSWLFGIALRQARRGAEKRARAGGAQDGEALLAELEGPERVSQHWDEEWNRVLVEQCLRRAEEECEVETFRCFRAVVLEGLGAADAARELGVPVKKVYNAKHRVLERMRRLREELEDV